MGSAGEMAKFCFQLIRNPKSVGAVAPSSSGLSQAMAEPVAHIHEGIVLEFGPGTGPVTEALLSCGIAPERLCLLEYSANFAARLRKRFRGVRVIEGDAFAFDQYLESDDRAVAAVSSLPMLNFEPELRQAFLGKVLEHLPPGAPFVQFSYGLESPFTVDDPSITVEKGKWILKNLPPARVWIFRKVA